MKLYCLLTLYSYLEDEDDDGGASPFDDENDLQDLVEDAIYRFPLGDHDTGNFMNSDILQSALCTFYIELKSKSQRLPLIYQMT